MHSYCTTKEFKTDISQLCDKCPLLVIIPKKIEEQIIFQAKERYETNPDSIFQYIQSEIENAERKMTKMFFDSKKKGMYLDKISEIYIWNKERIKALLKFKKTIQNLKEVESEKNSTKKIVHFTRSSNNTEQQSLFDGLTNYGFIPKDTNRGHFNFVFGGIAIPDNEKQFEPLIWQKSVGLLAYCVENLFADTDKDNIWKITANCFLWKGNIPNKNTMKNTVSKYNNNNSNKPKGYKQIDAIINNL